MPPIDKSILITGSSTGIGYATAHFLRERGWRVFASCRAEEDCARLRDEGFEAPRIDLEDTDTILEGAETVLGATDGKLGALFNNGAYAIPGAVEDLPTAALRTGFEANFFGWHTLTRALIPTFRANGAGRIAQNSSVLGFVPLPLRGAYVSSKYALEGLTDVLRLELRGTGIGVSLIEPGPVTSQFRVNAAKQFERWIDETHSVRAETYAQLRERHARAGKKDPFELPPEAVARKLLHALTSARPKPRYYVTTPTYALGALKRILSTRGLDAILSRAG